MVGLQPGFHRALFFLIAAVTARIPLCGDMITNCSGPPASILRCCVLCSRKHQTGQNRERMCS